MVNSTAPVDMKWCPGEMGLFHAVLQYSAEGSGPGLKRTDLSGRRVYMYRG
jgi:hypothetical protein